MTSYSYKPGIVLCVLQVVTHCNPHNNVQGQALLSHFVSDTIETQRLRNLPKVTLLGGVRNQAGVPLSDKCFKPHISFSAQWRASSRFSREGWMEFYSVIPFVDPQFIDETIEDKSSHEGNGKLEVRFCYAKSWSLRKTSAYCLLIPKK